MFDFVVLFHLLVAGGIGYFAFRYAFGPVPNMYQAEIMKLPEGQPDGPLLLVLTLLYRVAGFGLIAAALGYGALAIGGVTADLFWAKAVMLAMAFLLGVPLMVVLYRTELNTSVETPWRSVLLLTAAAILAFVLSLL